MKRLVERANDYDMRIITNKTKTMKVSKGNKGTVNKFQIPRRRVDGRWKM